MRPIQLAALLLAPAAGIAAAPPPYAGLPTQIGYVELTRMAVAAPLVVAADVTSAVPLKPAQAPGLAPGTTRYYVEAAAVALVSGRAELPPAISYLVDLPDDERGRPRKLKRLQVLLLAAPTSTPGTLRLVGPHAQVPRTPENEARLRAILTALVAPGAPPPITGVARAFHVPGSLPGESETQIFLRTADARPISLSVLRRPGEAPRWVVALTEMVDDSAAPPKPETLLWYRLACGLPRALPDAALAGSADNDVRASREDYGFVLSSLGPCA